MKVVCISDTHGIHSRMKHSIPDGDILLHAGDITKNGRQEDLYDVEIWMKSLSHPCKIFTPGNHDWIFQQDPEFAKSMIPSATCLIDEGIEFGGVKIWGSPWQPEFHDWAFNLPLGNALSEKWSLIPDDSDIVMTHGPPAGILDQSSHGAHVGCPDLTVRMKEISPRLHLFGHIHEAYGQETYGDTEFVNASICNLGYKPVNPAIVVVLPE